MDNTRIPSDEQIQSTAEQIKARGIDVKVVENKVEALEALKSFIPENSEVMTGSSTSLNEIGFTDYLKSPESKYKNIGENIWAENDEAKRNDLRRNADTAEYFVSSVNAITEDGMLVAVDATGSRVGAIPFAAKNVIFVISANKISGNLESAMKRIKEYVFPLENERMQKVYGVGSTFGKWVIVEREVNPTRMKVILVKEKLGF